MKRLIISIFLCFLFFILAFFIEFYLSSLFKLSLIAVEIISEQFGIGVIKNNLFSAQIISAALLAFMFSLSFADYLLQNNRVAVNVQKRISWMRIIGISMVFFLGMLIAYIQSLYPFVLGGMYLGDSTSISIDVSKWFDKLLIYQWTLGSSLAFLWFQFYPREKNA